MLYPHLEQAPGLPFVAASEVRGSWASARCGERGSAARGVGIPPAPLRASLSASALPFHPLCASMYPRGPAAGLGVVETPPEPIAEFRIPNQLTLWNFNRTGIRKDGYTKELHRDLLI